MDSETVTQDALPDGLVVADADGNVVLTNDVAREQLGLDGDGGIGRPLRDVLLLRDRDGDGVVDHATGRTTGWPTGSRSPSSPGSCRGATRCSSPDGWCAPGAAAP